MTFFVNFFVAAVLMGTTLMYGTLGEILTEKSGNMNLGVEGLIFMGGSTGLIAASGMSVVMMAFFRSGGAGCSRKAARHRGSSSSAR